MGNTNFVHDNTVINVVPTMPDDPAVGAPVQIGQIPGVAVEKAGADGKVVTRIRGVFRMAVSAVRFEENVAVNVGDTLFVGRGNDVLDHAGVGAVRFGVALEEVPSGQQADILVLMKDSPHVVPGSPGTPTSSTQTSSSVTLAWTAPSNDGGLSDLEYEISYKLNSASDYNNSVSGISTLTIQMTGLTAGTSYDFRVRARNSLGYGAWSSALTQSTQT